MSDTNDTNETRPHLEQLKEAASACGPGCNCNTGTSGRPRWVLGVIVIVVAGVLVARAAMKSDGVSAPKPTTEFAMPQGVGTAGAAAAAPELEPRPKTEPKVSDVAPNTDALAAPQQDAEAAKREEPVVCGELMQSLSDLNQKAMDMDGVFVFLVGNDTAKSREIASVIEKGAATLQGRNIKMGVFTLKTDSNEYANIARQVAPPCVLAMVKGRGAVAIGDDVTEPKLIQAFVAAANAGGGCDPSRCPSSSTNCN